MLKPSGSGWRRGGGGVGELIAMMSVASGIHLFNATFGRGGGMTFIFTVHHLSIVFQYTGDRRVAVRRSIHMCLILLATSHAADTHTHTHT